MQYIGFGGYILYFGIYFASNYNLSNSDLPVSVNGYGTVTEIDKLLLFIPCDTVKNDIGSCHEKTGFLNMRKQRRRSASR